MKQINNTHDRSRSRAANRRRWQAHIAAQDRSGLNRAEYCRHHDLSYDAMTYWQRRLEAGNQSGEILTLVPVPLSPAPLPESLQGSQLQMQLLLLPGNMTVALGDDFSSAALTRLLSVLEAR